MAAQGPKNHKIWPKAAALAVLLGRGSLLPQVRRADAATLVPADGTSRRHQIKDTGSLHVARVPAMTFNRAEINSIPCLATKETIHG